MKSPEAEDYCVAVVGAGAMGQGIAQVSAMGGMRVILFDAREAGAGPARESICKRLDRLVEKGRQTADQAEAAKAAIEVAGSLQDIAPAVPPGASWARPMPLHFPPARDGHRACSG